MIGPQTNRSKTGKKTGGRYKYIVPKSLPATRVAMYTPLSPPPAMHDRSCYTPIAMRLGQVRSRDTLFAVLAITLGGVGATR